MRRHKSTPPQNALSPAQDAEPVDDKVQQSEPIWVLDLACCCPSRPAVRVVMPAAADRPRKAELLLCGHHYRASQKNLVEAGASVFDREGALISSAAPLD
jgi:hypothetical protein